MKNLVSAFIISLVAISSYAHEGHDKAPSGIQAPHPGGKIQGSSHMYVELVRSGQELKLYPFTHDMAPIELSKVVIQAVARPARKTTVDKLKFDPQSDHFSGKYESKGVNRYTLELLVSYAGKKEKISFNVENR